MKLEYHKFDEMLMHVQSGTIGTKEEWEACLEHRYKTLVAMCEELLPCNPVKFIKTKEQYIDEFLYGLQNVKVHPHLKFQDGERFLNSDYAKNESRSNFAYENDKEKRNE